MANSSVKPMAVIGYSGHAYVIIDIFQNAGRSVTAYCDSVINEKNPFGLQYLGPETGALDRLKEFDYFIAIGNNAIRHKVHNALAVELGEPANAIHPRAVVASSANLKSGTMIAAGAIINPLVSLGTGVICNTSCSIDHECVIGDFAHIGPGAVLSGNVQVGENSFVGAGAVVKQGLKIGRNVTVGAGTVVIRDVPDNVVVVGNPHRVLTKE